MSAAHLIPETDLRQAARPSHIPRTRLQEGIRYADIVHDRRGTLPIFACVGQKRGSNDILFLGQFRTLLEARRAASQFVRASADSLPFAVDPIAADANSHLCTSAHLVASSKRLLSGARTLIQQSRNTLHPPHRGFKLDAIGRTR